MREIWKDVPGYNGTYQVSNCGRIRSWADNHKKRRESPVIRKTRTGKAGYLYLNLWVNGIYKTVKVHKLVAECFCEKPENAECVNHKNGDKTDNRAENLEWCTLSQNTRHAYKIGLIKPTKGELNGMYGVHGKMHPSSKPVLQFTLENKLVAEYDSGIEAGRALNVCGASIQRCARGKRKTAFGYKWRYKDED